MHSEHKILNVQFDKAVHLLVNHIPISEEHARKPLLPHNFDDPIFQELKEVYSA